MRFVVLCESEIFTKSRGAAMSKYVLDERILSKQLGFYIGYPIRVFSLEGLGFNQEAFLRALTPTFALCPPDEYVVKLSQVNYLKSFFPSATKWLDEFLVAYYANQSSLGSTFSLISLLTPRERQEFERIDVTFRRHRSMAKFVLRLVSGVWHIERVDAGSLSQKVDGDDPRSLKRSFVETSRFVSDHGAFKHLLRILADMVREIHPSASLLEIGFHQMVVYADALGEANNAPEGIHQDGADYIVSALVMERAGITGGESIVYGPDRKTEYLRYTLQPGEGIFQADNLTSPLWHAVTPIQEDPAVPPAYGNRSIFGFDMTILEGK